MLDPAEVDVCDVDPGYPVAVTVTAGLRRLTEVWRGDSSWPEALRTGAIEVDGPEALRRALPRWFMLSAFAAVPRPVRDPGTESSHRDDERGAGHGEPG